MDDALEEVRADRQVRDVSGLAGEDERREAGQAIGGEIAQRQAERQRELRQAATAERGDLGERVDLAALVGAAQRVAHPQRRDAVAAARGVEPPRAASEVLRVDL